MHLDLLDSRAVCETAEDACLGRLREILLRLESGDHPLRRLIEDVERHDREAMEHLRMLEGGGPAETLDVEAYFPSLRVSLGEAALNRDSAMYYVETLKEEAWRFFRDLARVATDDVARAAYARLAMENLGDVARLRSVIL